MSNSEALKIIPMENRLPSELDHLMVNVTPAIAKSLLKRNHKNRNPKDSNIANLKMQMLQNQWNPLNGESIKISKSGQLIDGQHRLQAVIAADVNVPILFTFNCDEESLITVDGGVSRSASDVLKIHGVKYYANIPSVVRFETMAPLGLNSTKSMSSSARTEVNLSNHQILDKAIKEKHVYYAVMKQAQLWQFKMKKLLRTSLIAKYYNVFSRIDRGLAYEFFEILSSRKELTPNHPIGALQDFLLTDAMNTLRKYSSHEKEIAIAKTWNAWLNGETVRKLKVTATDRFPKLSGVERLTQKTPAGIPITQYELKKEVLEDELSEQVV